MTFHDAFVFQCALVSINPLCCQLFNSPPLADSDQCMATFTDQRYEINPDGSVTVEWAGTGPTADVNVDQFMCTLNDEASVSCELLCVHALTQH